MSWNNWKKKQRKVYFFIFFFFLIFGLILDYVLVSYKDNIVNRDINSKVHLVASFVLDVDNRKGIDAIDRIYNSEFSKHFLNFLIDQDGFEHFMDPYVYGKPDLEEFIKDKYFDFKIYSPSTRYMIVVRVFSFPNDFEFGELIYSKFKKMNIGEHLNKLYSRRVIVANDYVTGGDFNDAKKKDEKIEAFLTEQVYKFLKQGNDLDLKESQSLLEINDYLENLKMDKNLLTKKNKPLLEIGIDQVIIDEMKTLKENSNYLNLNISDLKYNEFTSREFKTFPIITLVFLFISLFTILLINILLYKKS